MGFVGSITTSSTPATGLRPPSQAINNRGRDGGSLLRPRRPGAWPRQAMTKLSASGIPAPDTASNSRSRRLLRLFTHIRDIFGSDFRRSPQHIWLHYCRKHYQCSGSPLSHQHGVSAILEDIKFYSPFAPFPSKNGTFMSSRKCGSVIEDGSTGPIDRDHSWLPLDSV